MTEGIRPSQFVTMYGPGTILETASGPVVVPTPDTGLFYRNSGLSPRTYSVDTVVETMAAAITGRDNTAGGMGIFCVPSNAELGRGSEDAIYRTIPFYKWRLCLRQDDHRKLAENPADKIDVLHDGDRCPVCTHKSRGKNAIRFVAVCNNGHLDDVDWNFAVHRGSCKKGPQRHFLWRRTGIALKYITIACPACGEQVNFGKHFYIEQRCSGRHPHREPTGSGPRRNPRSCDKKSRIMQRQAANIRVPEVKTYLAIHPARTKLDSLARAFGIGGAGSIASKLPGGLANDDNFELFISGMRDIRVPDSTISEFQRAKRNEVVRVVDDIKSAPPKTHTEMLNREYSVLVRASKEGAPTESREGSGPPSFEVRKRDVRSTAAETRLKFTVVPVQTLEAVTVQFGFRRIVPSRKPAGVQAEENPSALVDVGFNDEDDKRWYPGTLLRGEGLFITLDRDLAVSGDASKAWRRGVKDGYPEYLFRDPHTSRDELDPEFVWWHTLSHLLVRSIGELAGYSAASIRERVYYGERMRPGGILLYATQPGTGGTLGGLVGLAPRIGSFIARAKEQSYTCSADPVCEQDRFAPGKVIGSCCYGCLLNPETSCEHMNMWLDRKVVGENLP